jgi:RNA polymerase sigma factor (sigma-70 family)
MSISDPNFHALAFHQERIRALARALLRDEHAAEDIVQDTWVRALERRPHDLGNGAGWFAQVARRFALNRLRSDARRDTRERSAARPEAVPSSAEIAARVELQRVLLDAVEGLPDPFPPRARMYTWPRACARAISTRGVDQYTSRSALERSYCSSSSDRSTRR